MGDEEKNRDTGYEGQNERDMGYEGAGVTPPPWSVQKYTSFAVMLSCQI